MTTTPNPSSVSRVSRETRPATPARYRCSCGVACADPALVDSLAEPCAVGGFHAWRAVSSSTDAASGEVPTHHPSCPARAGHGPCLGCGFPASSSTVAAVTTLTTSQVGVIRWALDQLVDRVTLESSEPTEARDALEASSLFALLEDAGNARGQVLMLVSL